MMEFCCHVFCKFLSKNPHIPSMTCHHVLYFNYPWLWCLPWYLMAMPVDVPVASVVSSMKRCLDVLSRPSLGRYSTSYESYRAAASMLLPFLISSLEEREQRTI